jgi:predicted alpha/beta-hydrolase family hydrolase
MRAERRKGRALVAAARVGIMQLLAPTPLGDARITRFPAVGARRAALLVGHGAGGGVEAPDLRALAADLPKDGIEVALVEQPWRVAGKRLAPAPKSLDVGWRAVMEWWAANAGADGVPVIVGGRSAGARVACRTGADTGAHGVLALSFPLHPPGRPEKSRIAELLGSGLPTLVVVGAMDQFGAPSEYPELPPTHRLVGLPAGDHGFSVRKSQTPVIDDITRAAAAWIDSIL